MLSDTLFGISCTLAEELKYPEDYPAEILKDIFDGWLKLECVRVMLDRSPCEGHISAEEAARLARLAITMYLQKVSFSQDKLEISLSL